MILDLRSFQRAVDELATSDPTLGRAVAAWGPPPFWTQPRGFPGVVISILAQQVSIESADAAFAKLEGTLGDVTPDRFLSLDDRGLKEVGFSRQKASYVRGIAHAVLSGEVDLNALETMSDETARESLMALRGVGPWTADAYLLFSLQRADAWPPADLALLKAIQELKGLSSSPAPEQGDTIAETWRPWRSVAARILWHHYLCLRGRASAG